MKRPLLSPLLPCPTRPVVAVVSSLVSSLAAWGVLCLVVGACSSTPQSSDKVTVTGPIPGDFSASVGGVNPVFELHCGSFDCHGNPSRALRIYGQNGLRLPNEAGIIPGGAATTSDEVSANYRSIIAVEPEQTNAVVRAGETGDPSSQLLVLKKPLQIETHKGGPVLNKGDDPEKCISSWFKGKTDKAACTAGALAP